MSETRNMPLFGYLNWEKTANRSCRLCTFNKLCHEFSIAHATNQEVNGYKTRFKCPITVEEVKLFHGRIIQV